MQTGGVFKFVTIALYTLVLIGLAIGLVKGLIIWGNTGDWKPAVHASFGQVFYWDAQIYDGVQTLKDEELMNSVPGNFRDQYKEFIVQQILLYLFLFIVIGFLLFKFGNWVVGSASYEASTDIIIISIIIFIAFPLMQISYGYLMFNEFTTPYKGVVELFKPSTWSVMFTDLNFDIYGNNTMVNRTIIDVGGT